jgi:hypothetical protein
MDLTKEQIDNEKKKLKEKYGKLFDSTAQILFKHDPIEINFNHNTDEYEPEARTILPKLKDCHSSEDVLNIVYEEFCHWFGSETAGVKQNYEKIADEVWNLWKQN